MTKGAVEEDFKGRNVFVSDIELIYAGTSFTLTTIKEISKSYRSRSRTVEVLDRISFCAEEGRSYAIVGESGSGKSVMSQSVMKLEA